MNIKRVDDFTSGGYYTTMFESDFEFVNPIEQTEKSTIQLFSEMEKDMLVMNVGVIPKHIVDDINKRAVKNWREQYEEILSTKIPKELIKLLESTSKKEQVQLLKGVRFNPEQLISFIFYAWLNYGYRYSQYSAKHHHTGLKVEELPTIIEIKKDGEVNKVGETTLSDGQLKQVIEQRRVTVSKFLDQGDNWHCFFTTFRSLRGEENWKSGQPHYHYISDKFGLSRNEVVAQLKSKEYKLGNLPHIDLLDYPSNGGH